MGVVKVFLTPMTAKPLLFGVRGRYQAVFSISLTWTRTHGLGTLRLPRGVSFNRFIAGATYFVCPETHL